jgi:hypothetical protein
MTAYQLTIIAPAKLEIVTFICKCAARITVPYGKFVEKCPACHEEFDKAPQSALRSLELFHQDIKRSEAKSEFPIQRPV